MLEADTLAGLANDLRALSARERSSVLAVLSPYERAQVAALIDAASTPAPVPAATEDYSRFSPWLARHLGTDADGAADRNVTAATRRLLAEAGAELGPAPAQPAAEPAPRRRSLADAVGQVLFPRRTMR
jgi:hypothetical protein